MSQQTTANMRQIDNTSDQCQSEGAEIIQLSSMTFDGTGSITYQYGTDAIVMRKPSSIRSMYFDARLLSADAILTITNGQVIRLPNGKQGYIPLYNPVPMNISVTSAAGNGSITIYFYNFRVPPIIW